MRLPSVVYVCDITKRNEVKYSTCKLVVRVTRFQGSEIDFVRANYRRTSEWPSVGALANLL